jgi:hypothetical protein
MEKYRRREARNDSSLSAFHWSAMASVVEFVGFDSLAEEIRTVFR